MSPPSVSSSTGTGWARPSTSASPSTSTSTSSDTETDRLLPNRNNDNTYVDEGGQHLWEDAVLVIFAVLFIAGGVAMMVKFFWESIGLVI